MAKATDITGKKFNKLTAISRVGKTSTSRSIWLFSCDCGNEKEIVISNVTSGKTQSCGCLQLDVKRKTIANARSFSSKKPKDLKGEKFGNLLVLEKSDSISKNNSNVWQCLCDCGNLKVVSSRNLLTGHTKSCGCLAKISGEKHPAFKHGQSPKKGYVRVYVAGKAVPEHRLIMERIIKRPLLPHPLETVHHKNGIRNDNRPENLELWAGIQPSGQRVEDLVRFARQILETYGEMFPE